MYLLYKVAADLKEPGYSPGLIKEIEKLIKKNKYKCTIENFRDCSPGVWWDVGYNNKLSEEFIREFADKLNWEVLSFTQHLSEDFIKEFEDKWDWKALSHIQMLSEEFIREFADKIDWKYITFGQHLSEDFIREFEDKIDYWDMLAFNDNLDVSDEFRQWLVSKMSPAAKDRYDYLKGPQKNYDAGTVFEELANELGVAVSDLEEQFEESLTEEGLGPVYDMWAELVRKHDPDYYAELEEQLGDEIPDDIYGMWEEAIKRYDPNYYVELVKQFADGY